MPAVPQGRHGYLSINNSIFGGAKLLPVFSWSMPNPDNLVTPMPVGNSFVTHYGKGLATTQCVVAFDVRHDNTEVLSLNFWNSFQSRTWASGFDDTVASTLIASDGSSLWTLANAKFESFTINATKGQQIGVQAVFVAPGVPTQSAHVPAAYAPASSSAPLMYDTADLTTGVTGDWYGVEISAANNHVPNGPMGSAYGKNLSSWDAGVMSAAMSLTTAARTNAIGEPITPEAQVVLRLAGGATRNLTLQSVVPENPRDRGAQGTAQSFQTRRYIVMGLATPANPLVVT